MTSTMPVLTQLATKGSKRCGATVTVFAVRGTETVANLQAIEIE